MESQELIPSTGQTTGALPPLFQGDVVELSLLLPKRRAEALLDMSIKRCESVAQILRQMIERALASEPVVA